MSAMAFQNASVSVVYSIVCSVADQRTHRSSASLAFVRGIHRWLGNSPHKGPVTRNFFHFMTSSWWLHPHLKSKWCALYGMMKTWYWRAWISKDSHINSWGVITNVIIATAVWPWVSIYTPQRFMGWHYRKVSNIRRTLVGNKIVDHSDVVGASPVGAAPTTSSFST